MLIKTCNALSQMRQRNVWKTKKIEFKWVRILVRHYGFCEEVFGVTTEGASGYGRKIKREKSVIWTWFYERLNYL